MKLSFDTIGLILRHKEENSLYQHAKSQYINLIEEQAKNSKIISKPSQSFWTKIFNKAEGMGPISGVPDHLWKVILVHMMPKELFTMSLTCKKLRQLASGRFSSQKCLELVGDDLWRNLIERMYPFELSVHPNIHGKSYYCTIHKNKVISPNPKDELVSEEDIPYPLYCTSSKMHFRVTKHEKEKHWEGEKFQDGLVKYTYVNLLR